MKQTSAKSLAIDQSVFRMAFDRDTAFHDAEPMTPYLDCETGELLFIFETDADAETIGCRAQDNKATRQRVTMKAGRFLKIPGLTHGQHHDILRAFLASHWTHNADEHSAAVCAYHKSIGKWKDSVGEDTYYRYVEFRDETTEKMAEAFLQKHGIRPKWT